MWTILMALSLVTAPTLEPLTIGEAKAQLRLDAANVEPAPSAPLCALAFAGAGNVTNGAHRYAATFVTADGETDCGEVSGAVTVGNNASNGKVTLSSIPTGGQAVTARKLYRTIAGGSTLLLLATISDNSTTTYTDNIADGSLAAQAPTSNSTSDPELTTWILAVRERCELSTRRALLTQTWDLALDRFPCERYVEIPKPPLQSIASVTYLDTSGTLQTLTPTTQYVVQAPAGPRAARGRIALPFAGVWPVTLRQMGAVTIRFVCGYGSSRSAVPGLLLAGMKQDLGTLYEQREGVMVDRYVTATELPMGVRAIYASYRSLATQRLADGYAA